MPRKHNTTTPPEQPDLNTTLVDTPTTIVPDKYKFPLHDRHREEGFVDIYDIWAILQMEDDELKHALKKIACAGLRDKGPAAQDVAEAIVALYRWFERRGTAFPGNLELRNVDNCPF